MANKEFSFSTFNKYSSTGIYQSLIDCNVKNKNIGSYIYGTLNFPITAKEIEYARTYLKQMHPNSISIAIDAAIGDSNDIGLIRVFDKGLKPGLGVDKNLGVVGDISIIGVVASKSNKNFNLFNLTRLNLIYKMAETIANGIEQYITYLNSKDDFLLNKSFGA